jgi:hypothetical protein
VKRANIHELLTHANVIVLQHHASTPGVIRGSPPLAGSPARKTHVGALRLALCSTMCERTSPRVGKGGPAGPHAATRHAGHDAASSRGRARPARERTAGPARWQASAGWRESVRRLAVVRGPATRVFLFLCRFSSPISGSGPVQHPKI